MKRYDVSPTADRYYRQNNNEISPGVTCKPTSTVMALDVAGWPLPQGGDYRQPEDDLTELCRSPEGQAFMLSVDPALTGTQPNEVWQVIKWAVGRWYPGRAPVVGPRWDWDLREALFGLARGVPFAASTWLTKGGHVVMLAGFETGQEELPDDWRGLDLGAVTKVLVDDPYGLHGDSGYDTSKSGYHTEYDLAGWKKFWRGTGIQISKYEP